MNVRIPSALLNSKGAPMVTDEQILRLRQALQKGMSLSLAAAKAGMDRKTARTYRQLDRLPSEVGMEHTWRTRTDPFDDAWPWVEEQLALNPRPGIVEGVGACRS